MTIHFSAIHLDVLPFIWSNGGSILHGNDVVMNDPANVETLNYLQALTRNRVLPGPDTFDKLKGSYSNAKRLFLQGKSAYIITWNNRIADFEASPLSEKFGILPIPPLKKGQPSYSVIGSWYFAVNTFSAHKEGALEFLRYLLDDKTQLDLALKSSAFIPASKSVYTNSRLNSENRYLRDLQVAMANMRHRLKHPKEPQISQVLENTIKEILIKGKPVGEMLDIAQNRIASICGRAN
jgi:ABC-type glycerol-3-phosphate transport system substrate-binding protein